MNIKNHILAANSYLKMADEKVDRKEYVGAQAALAEAYAHTREVLMQVDKLRVLNAHRAARPVEGP